MLHAVTCSSSYAHATVHVARTELSSSDGSCFTDCRRRWWRIDSSSAANDSSAAAAAAAAAASEGSGMENFTWGCDKDTGRGQAAESGLGGCRRASSLGLMKRLGGEVGVISGCCCCCSEASPAMVGWMRSGRNSSDASGVVG